MWDDVTHWLPGSPHLSPAWRWHLAHWLQGNRPNHGDLDDEWLSRCEAFVFGECADDNSGDGAEPGGVDHAIEAARHIWRDKHLRPRLEAFLLTGAPLKEVADRCLLPVATVEAYAALFYDVIDRRHCRDWIINFVIGRLPDDPNDEGEWLAKTIAYHGGPLIFDTYLAVIGDEPLAVPVGLSDAEASAFVAEQKFCCKLLVAQLSARSAADAEAVARIAKKFRPVKKPPRLKTPQLEPIEELMIDVLKMANRSGRKPPAKSQSRLKLPRSEHGKAARAPSSLSALR